MYDIVYNKKLQSDSKEWNNPEIWIEMRKRPSWYAHDKTDHGACVSLTGVFKFLIMKEHHSDIDWNSLCKKGG